MPYESAQDETAYCKKIEHDFHSIHGERVREYFYYNEHQNISDKYDNSCYFSLHLRNIFF